MSSNPLISPTLIHVNANARNGMVPSAWFHTRIKDVTNHLVAYGANREVYRKAWELNVVDGFTGTTNVGRFRFRTNRAATILTYVIVMGLDTHNAATNPRVDIDTTISGGATTTNTFYYGLERTGTADGPNDHYVTTASVAVTASTVYEVLIKAIDYARVLAVCAYEESSQTIIAPTYVATNFVAGMPIYDAHREAMLAKLSNMYRQGAITAHWGLLDGSARTRLSATSINLIDNATTGTPVAGTDPGWYIDPRYHRTWSRTTVPFEFACYASMSAGTGTVRLIDTAGTTYGTCSVTSATPGWVVGTAVAIAEAAELFVVPQFAGDGAGTLSVYAVSLGEYEA